MAALPHASQRADAIVLEACALIDSGGLPHPSPRLLKNFILQALDPRAPANFVLKTCEPFKYDATGLGLHARLSELLADWKFIVQAGRSSILFYVSTFSHLCSQGAIRLNPPVKSQTMATNRRFLVCRHRKQSSGVTGECAASPVRRELQTTL